MRHENVLGDYSVKSEWKKKNPQFLKQKQNKINGPNCALRW